MTKTVWAPRGRNAAASHCAAVPGSCGGSGLWSPSAPALASASVTYRQNRPDSASDASSVSQAAGLLGGLDAAHCAAATVLPPPAGPVISVTRRLTAASI